ncbi:MAG TPA: hypothetical protein VFS36_11195 [Chitinophagaceae bacterium]|nr:hypothetical protein [Chitinophagaceae bacterium]
MKKTIFLSAAAFIISVAAVAQCGKSVTWTGTKTEFMDENGNLQRTDNGKVQCRMDDKSIVFVHNDEENDAISGDIKDLSCQWQEPFKNGKTSFSSQLQESSGDLKDGKITIEGKDGKINIYLDISAPDGRKMKVKFYVDSFEEKG